MVQQGWHLYSLMNQCAIVVLCMAIFWPVANKTLGNYVRDGRFELQFLGFLLAFSVFTYKASTYWGLFTVTATNRPNLRCFIAVLLYSRCVLSLFSSLFCIYRLFRKPSERFELNRPTYKIRPLVELETGETLCVYSWALLVCGIWKTKKEKY